MALGHQNLLLSAQILSQGNHLVISKAYKTVFLLTGLQKYAVFLFSILGMGAEPSELGKLACKLWKLGKVQTHKQLSEFKCTVLCLKDCMALFFAFTAKKKKIKGFHVYTEFLT